jgi:hypothetical protein
MGNEPYSPALSKWAFVDENGLDAFNVRVDMLYGNALSLMYT